jgi:two-component system CheB/CheR fusion protein
MTVNESPDNAELKHRIRRLLSVIRSIAVHMSAHETDPRESALHLAGRVGAIGRVAVTPVSNGIDLESLVLDELRVHGVHRASIVVKGPAVRLNAKSAELMSLALHELATNAIKFGALSQSQSKLRVLWYFTDASNSRLRFEWAEYGVQLAAGARRNPGFGSDVVKRLIASELRGKGEMSFLDEGVLCTIEIPANEALQQNE